MGNNFSKKFLKNNSSNESPKPKSPKRNNGNLFQLNLLKEVNKLNKGSNILISPFSLNIILRIIYNGSNNETKKELENILISGISKKEFNSLPKIQQQTNSISDLSIANDILLGIEPLKPFLDECKEYDTFIDKLISASQINNWCSEKTNGRIKSMINDIEVAKIILLNKIYFKSKWKKEFSPDNTFESIFTRTDNQQENVKFMNKTFYTFYYENKNAQIIKLDYNCPCAAYILLPRINFTIDNFINNLSSSELSNMINSLYYRRVTLFLPKFKIEENNIDFIEVLKSINLKYCFSEKANFEKISKKIKLYIEKIYQKGYIEVNEKGTEAVIITLLREDIILMPNAQNPDEPIIMNCNRPFLFFISPDMTDLPKDNFLFASIVNKIEGFQTSVTISMRVLIYGEEKVGKTFLIKSTVESFKDNDNFISQKMTINNQNYHFNIFEINKNFKAYYPKKNDIQIFVFNSSDINSFYNLKNIFYENNRYGISCIVGIKWNENNIINFEEIEKFIQENNIKFIQISPNDKDSLKQILSIILKDYEK